MSVHSAHAVPSESRRGYETGDMDGYEWNQMQVPIKSSQGF